MATKKQNGSVVTDENGQVAEPDQKALAAVGNEHRAVTAASINSVAIGEIGGEVGEIKPRLPYLTVGHAMGKYQGFVKGSLILGDDNLIADPGKPVNITVLSMLTYWKEYTSGAAYDPEYTPNTFATKAEVLAAGFTTEWTNNKGADYKLAHTITCLVQKPEDVVCGLFGIELGGEAAGEDSEPTLWAPAIWNTDKTAAQRVGPTIKSDLNFSLRRRGLLSGIYKLRTKEESFSSGNTAWVPRVRLNDYHSEAVVKQICGMFADRMNP